MVSNIIAYAISGIFAAVGAMSLLGWLTIEGHKPKYFWGAIASLAVAYVWALIGGI